MHGGVFAGGLGHSQLPQRVRYKASGHRRIDAAAQRHDEVRRRLAPRSCRGVQCCHVPHHVTCGGGEKALAALLVGQVPRGHAAVPCEQKQDITAGVVAGLGVLRVVLQRQHAQLGARSCGNRWPLAHGNSVQAPTCNDVVPMAGPHM